MSLHGTLRLQEAVTFVKCVDGEVVLYSLKIFLVLSTCGIASKKTMFTGRGLKTAYIIHQHPLKFQLHL